MFIYTVIPCFKKAEQSLLEERKVSSYVIDVTINILCLATGQYAAGALDIFFFHVDQKGVQSVILENSFCKKKERKIFIKNVNN